MAADIEDDSPTTMRPPTSPQQDEGDEDDLHGWALCVLGELELSALEGEALASPA